MSKLKGGQSGLPPPPGWMRLSTEHANEIVNESGAPALFQRMLEHRFAVSTEEARRMASSAKIVTFEVVCASIHSLITTQTTEHFSVPYQQEDPNYRYEKNTEYLMRAVMRPLSTEVNPFPGDCALSISAWRQLGEVDVHACASCDASGEVVCSSCGGRASAICPTCSGRKELQCFECTAGRVHCGSCAGTGQTRSLFNDELTRCYDCSGTGRRECLNCKGRGSIRCRNCGGSGRLYCRSCEGEGSKECSKCEGVGQLASFERINVTADIDPFFRTSFEYAYTNGEWLVDSDHPPRALRRDSCWFLDATNDVFDLELPVFVAKQLEPKLGVVLSVSEKNRSCLGAYVSIQSGRKHVCNFEMDGMPYTVPLWEDGSFAEELPDELQKKTRDIENNIVNTIVSKSGVDVTKAFEYIKRLNDGETSEQKRIVLKLTEALFDRIRKSAPSPTTTRALVTFYSNRIDLLENTLGVDFSKKNRLSVSNENDEIFKFIASGSNECLKQIDYLYSKYSRHESPTKKAISWAALMSFFLAIFLQFFAKHESTPWEIFGLAVFLFIPTFLMFFVQLEAERRKADAFLACWKFLPSSPILKFVVDAQFSVLDALFRPGASR